MTKLDDQLRPVASKLIKAFGKSVALSHFDLANTYDIASGSVLGTATGATGPTMDAATLKGVISSPTADQFVDGEVIAGDCFVVFASIDLTTQPQMGDTITFDGTTYRVINVNQQYSGALTATTTCHLRK